MTILPFTADKYEETKAILVEAGRFDDVWDSAEHWEEKIAKDPNSILVATDENEVIGCILIIEDPWTSFIFRLAVKETHRQKGIGSQLIEAAENQLRENGNEEVSIFVSADDEELQHFYERRGYKKGGEYRCMYKTLNA